MRSPNSRRPALARTIHAAVFLTAIIVMLPASAQNTVVTSRPCTFGSGPSTPGLACLLAHKDLGALPDVPIYWHIDTFPDEASANAAKDANGTVAFDYGRVWLFTVAGKDWRAKGGSHVADIGPLPVTKAPCFSAEYVHSYFSPGMSSQIHKHSGPEGFYAIEGDTCLEMPGGAHTGFGPGNTVIMPGGDPMMLMAIGTTPRRSFALILHDSTLPATTRIDDWKPEGICQAKFSKAAR